MLKLVKKKRARRKDFVEIELEKSEQSNVVDIVEVLKKNIASEVPRVGIVHSQIPQRRLVKVATQDA